MASTILTSNGLSGERIGQKERLAPEAAEAVTLKLLLAKAKKLGLPVAELMRHGASAYDSAQADEELSVLADAAKAAAERLAASIDDALAFIEASNKRIAEME